VRSNVSFLIPAIILALVIIPSLMTPVAQASGAVPLDTIKDRVSKAYNYEVALKRSEGGYAVIAEYPSIPIVVQVPSKGWWWIAGLNYYIISIS